MTTTYLHRCDLCGSAVESWDVRLPPDWKRSHRERPGFAGRPMTDACPSCRQPAEQPAAKAGRQLRSQVAVALREKPTYTDAELALYLAGEGVVVHAETVRRHRNALGVPPARVRRRQAR